MYFFKQEYLQVNPEPAPVVSKSTGDVQKGLSTSDHVITGEVHISGSHHIYLEPNTSMVVPKGEDGELDIVCSTQCPQSSQVNCINITKGMALYIDMDYSLSLQTFDLDFSPLV